MRISFVLPWLILLLFACKERTEKQPEPHLELGQRITFVGGDPDKAYLVVGYREFFEGKTVKDWKGQGYIVFVYLNDIGEVKNGIIHKNSVIKR